MMRGCEKFVPVLVVLITQHKTQILQSFFCSLLTEHCKKISLFFGVNLPFGLGGNPAT